MNAAGGVRLSELLRGAGVQPLNAPEADPIIHGATLDSRLARRGEIFFALPGFHVDGAAFARDAVGRGADAVVTAVARPEWAGESVAWVQVDDPRKVAGLLSREYHARPDEALTLVGITGTNGKTTVAYLVESIVAAAGRRSGRIGTVGTSFDDVQRATPHTTPEAPEFYRLLAEMRDRDVDIVSVEVSSHALSLHRVEGARFEVAAFLNLSRDHLDFHRDTESYFLAKASLFETLTSDQSAILPAGDPYAARIAANTQARVVTFGNHADADLRLEQVHCVADGSSAVLQTPSGPLPVRTRLPGPFNLDNVAAAAACALELGLPVDSITSGVLALEVVPGRMERVDRGQDFTVIVDFAHTEDALQNLLSSLRSLTRGHVIVVFGCGGERDHGKRVAMGQVAARQADRVFVTSDNPRSEDPQSIVDDVMRGVSSVTGGTDRTEGIVDRRQAIQQAIAVARPGDVVAIAGKGHETTQSSAGGTVPFDDRAVASEILGGLSSGAHHA